MCCPDLPSRIKDSTAVTGGAAGREPSVVSHFRDYEKLKTEKSHLLKAASGMTNTDRCIKAQSS